MSENKTDLPGIEAFGGFYHPVERPMPGGGTYSSGGITLRDWFAGQALPGVLSQMEGDAPSFEEVGSLAAKASYAIADAMIAKRFK